MVAGLETTRADVGGGTIGLPKKDTHMTNVILVSKTTPKTYAPSKTLQ